MSIDKLVVAEPMLIDPMAPKYFPSKAENLAAYKDGLTWEILEHPYHNADLVFKGSKYMVLDHNLQQVVYIMQWSIRSILNRKAAYQIMVWSDPGVNEIRGYAPKVFFSHLFAKTQLICTDRKQTPSGKRFWISVISSALQKGLYVYFVNLGTHPRIYALIDSMKKFEEYDGQGLIWSHDSKGQGQLLLISEEAIPQFHK